MKKSKASSALYSLCNRNKLDIKFIKVNPSKCASVKTNHNRLSQIEEILGYVNNEISKPRTSCKNVSSSSQQNSTKNELVSTPKSQHSRSSCNSPSILPSNLQISDVPWKNDSSQKYPSSSSSSTFFEVNSTTRVSSLETIILSDSSEGAIFNSSGDLISSNTCLPEIKPVSKKSSASKSTKKRKPAKKITYRNIHSAKCGSRVNKNDHILKGNTSSKELFSSEAESILNESFFVESPNVILPSPEEELPKTKNPRKNINAVVNSVSHSSKTLRYPLRNLVTLSPVIYDLPNCKNEHNNSSVLFSGSSTPKFEATPKKTISTPKSKKCDRYEMASKFQLLPHDFVQDSQEIEIVHVSNSVSTSRRTSKSNSICSNVHTSKATPSRSNKASATPKRSNTTPKPRNKEQPTRVSKNTPKEVHLSIGTSSVLFENSQDDFRNSFEPILGTNYCMPSPKSVPRPRGTPKRNNNNQRTQLSQCINVDSPKQTNRSTRKSSQRKDHSFRSPIDNLNTTSLQSVSDRMPNLKEGSKNKNGSQKVTPKNKNNARQRTTSSQKTSRKNNTTEIFTPLYESTDNIFDTSSNTPIDVYDFVPDSAISVSSKKMNSKAKSKRGQNTRVCQRTDSFNIFGTSSNTPLDLYDFVADSSTPKCDKTISKRKTGPIQRSKLSQRASNQTKSTQNYHMPTPRMVSRHRAILSQRKEPNKCEALERPAFSNSFLNVNKATVLRDMKNTPDRMKNCENYENNSHCSFFNENSSEQFSSIFKPFETSTQVNHVFSSGPVNSTSSTNNFAFRSRENYWNRPYGNLLAYIDNMNYNDNDMDMQELCHLFSMLKIANENTSQRTSFFSYRDPNSSGKNHIYRNVNTNFQKSKKIQLRESNLSNRQSNSNFLKTPSLPYLPVILAPQNEPVKENIQEFRYGFEVPPKEVKTDLMDAFNLKINVRPFLQEITHIQRKPPQFFHHNEDEEYNLDGLTDWN